MAKGDENLVGTLIYASIVYQRNKVGSDAAGIVTTFVCCYLFDFVCFCACVYMLVLNILQTLHVVRQLLPTTINAEYFRIKIEFAMLLGFNSI